MLDLSQLNAKDTVEVQILHPVTKKPTGAYVTVCGATSDTYTTAQIMAYTRMREGLKEGEKLTPEQAADALREVVVACIVGWRGLARGGEEIPYSREAAVELMSTPGYSWLRDQLTDAVNDLRNFF